MPFEDAIQKLRNLQRKAEQLDGQHAIPFSELFQSEFMLRNTDFPSIEAMFDASGFNIGSSEDFASIPDAEWDAFVIASTRFSSWEEMQSAAAHEWLAGRLELDN